MKDKAEVIPAFREAVNMSKVGLSQNPHALQIVSYVKRHEAQKPDKSPVVQWITRQPALELARAPAN
eukprot:1161443-Pelagomonas_calceolata.AAC.4